MNENHELENYQDQIKQLETEFEIALKNRDMFERLWYKWRNECRDINNAIFRLGNKIDKIKNTPQ